MTGAGGSQRSAEDEVRRKAERMRAARRQRRVFWSQVLQVGGLGWLVAVPAAGGGLGGQALGRWLGRPWIGIAGVVGGLVLGAWLAWRSVSRSMRERGGEQ